MPAAPKPGVGKRDEQKKTAKRVLTLIIRGEAYKLAPNNLPREERLLVRRTLGLPFSAFWSGQAVVDEDSLLVFWWLARRAAGEKTLTFDQAEEQFPDDLGADDIDIEDDNPDDEDNDPEA